MRMTPIRLRAVASSSGAADNPSAGAEYYKGALSAMRERGETKVRRMTILTTIRA